MIDIILCKHNEKVYEKLEYKKVFCTLLIEFLKLINNQMKQDQFYNLFKKLTTAKKLIFVSM